MIDAGSGQSGPAVDVGDRRSSDADLLRAVRGFAQRLRTPRSVGAADVRLLVVPFPGQVSVAPPPGVVAPSERPVGHTGRVGGALTSGVVVRIPVAWDCDILEWMIVANAAGSVSFTIARASWSAYPTTANIGSAGLTGAVKGRGSTAGWSPTHLHDSDILVITCNSVSGMSDCTLALRVREN